MRRFAQTVSLLLGFSVFCGARAAQVPSPEEVLGYPIGSRFTYHRDVVAYFERVAENSPRVVLREYGRTYGGRRLVYAVVASEANQSRLDSLRRLWAQLARPEALSRSAAREIAGPPG